jgi:CheY-like chemotaxis protein
MTARHILIVDDEPHVVTSLSRMLEHSDRSYQVGIAHSGEEALELLEHSPVDLLITDLRLPGITGLDLIRWVKASSPQTRTILITAYGNDEVEAEARRLEAYRYVTKPFDIGDFAQTVQEALRGLAISQPGLTILSDESFEAIVRQLDALRRDVGARCIFLADMQGQRLAEVGNTEGLDAATLLSLLAGGFATSGELARRFGSGQAINLNFHEGSRHEIYSANVGAGLFLIMIYDRQVQASRIGIVWFYTQQAIETLLSVISTAEADAPGRSLDLGFGDSLKAELDTHFFDPTD